MAWNVRYFVCDNGSVPAVGFEDSLPTALAARLDRWVKEVADKGYLVGGGIWKACRDYPGLWEVRAKVGPEAAREFATVDGSNLVLLCGIKKRFNEATPRSAFAQASQMLEEYRRTKRVQ